MDPTRESEEAVNKATVIFHAQETSGGMVNSVNGNLTIDDRTHIEYANFYITNTFVATEGNHEHRRGNICPTIPPLNKADTDTVIAPSRGARQPQHPGAFKLFSGYIDPAVVIQALRCPPGSADRSLIEIQVISDILDALMENPTLRHSAKLPDTLAYLQRILKLTESAVRVYQHGPLAHSLSLAIIAEAENCRQLLKELLSSLVNYQHVLSATMFYYVREYIWSSAGECVAFEDLNSKLRASHSSFAARILALGSIASAELEWGTGMEDPAEIAIFSFLFKQEYMSLQHIIVDTVIVVDHLARRLPVPSIFCQSWQDFNAVITGFCKETAGSGLIQQGDYRILSSDDEEYIDPKEVSTMLQPGMTVEMCIVLWEPVGGRYGSEEHRCPRCDHINSKVITVSGWVACRRCNGQFEISPESESIISPAIIDNLNLPDSRLLFRRISIKTAARKPRRGFFSRIFGKKN